jgi:hypothetical protein
VMGHYYTSRADPQRGCSPGRDRSSYLANWTRSLHHLASAESVIFHDELSDDFMDKVKASNSQVQFHSVNLTDASSQLLLFEKVDNQDEFNSQCKDTSLPVDAVIWKKLCKALPPNDLRFLVSLKYLTTSGGNDSDLVLITDLNDVTFHRDVFRFMSFMTSHDQGYDLFVGDELESNMGYMMKVLNKCYPKGGTGYTSGTVFNSGVIGGTRGAVKWLLSNMVKEFALALEQHGGRKFESGAVCDMSSMNKVSILSVNKISPNYSLLVLKLKTVFTHF